MTYYDQNALKLCHAFWRARLRTGMTCVDATAGRGRDAEVLCHLIGEDGHLFAFDIQPDLRQPQSNGGVRSGGGRRCF